MKALIFISGIVLTFVLTGYQHNTNSDLETEKYLNFLAAIKHSSTFSYFTVIKVKNLNTGETKEICTKGNFVAGAIHQELKLDYGRTGISKAYEVVKSKKDRYFEFKDKGALNNISFHKYDIKLSDKIQTMYDFNNIEETIKRDKAFSISLSDNEMKAFAHLLFNKGYLTGESDCWGGTLHYVGRPESVGAVDRGTDR